MLEIANACCCYAISPLGVGEPGSHALAPPRLLAQGVLPPPAKLAAGPSLAARLRGHVINLNVPKAEAVGDILGYQLAWQGQHCHFPDWQVRFACHAWAGQPAACAGNGACGLSCVALGCWSCCPAEARCVCCKSPAAPSHLIVPCSCRLQELEADPHVKEGHAGAVTLRAFRNAAGSLRGDASEGCDSAAVQQGWVAVTPIGLRSDVPLTATAAQERLQPELLRALAAAMHAAAGSLGVRVAGVPAELLASNSPAAAAGDQALAAAGSMA